MNKEQAKFLWETDIAAGYSPAAAKERLAHFAKTGIALPDPTQKYWGALVNQESGGDQSAVSPKGATGIAQVMPATGPEAADLAGLPWDPVAFRDDPVYNAKLGRAYFRKQMLDNGNDPVKALAAYNAGPGAVRKSGGDLSKLPEETQNYVPTIMNRADQSMQPDLDDPAQVAEAREALMTPRDRARKVYEDILAKGGTPEEAKEAVRQIARTQAAPAQQEQAPAQPSATPPVQQAPNDPMVMKIPDPVARQEALLQGGPVERFKAGLERSMSGTDRGARKLLAQLTGQSDQVARLEQQEQGVRDVNEQLDPTGSGMSMADVGKLSGDVATSATIGKMLPVGGVAGGTLAGGIQGGLQPTTAKDSQLVNAGVGSLLGGVISGTGSIATNLIGKRDPERALLRDALLRQGVKIPKGQAYDSPVGAVLRKMGGAKGSGPIPEETLTKSLAERMGMPGTDITNSSLEANLRRAGSAIGDLSKGKTAEPDRKFFKEVLDIGRKYQLAGPTSSGDETNVMLNHLLELSKPGSKISGEQYQALRTRLSGNSITGNPAQKTAMGDMKRALDKMFNGQNPSPERAGLNSQYRVSQILRKGSGIPAEGMSAKQLRNRIEGAANKGEVDPAVRGLLDQTNMLIPSTRIGGDAVAGAGDDVVIRGLDRPGLWSALQAATRGVAGPLSKYYDSGFVQGLVNNKPARASLANLLRGGVIPQAARLEQGEQ